LTRHFIRVLMIPGSGSLTVGNKRKLISTLTQPGLSGDLVSEVLLYRIKKVAFTDPNLLDTEAKNPQFEHIFINDTKFSFELVRSRPFVTEATEARPL
jgi:hypothetical protein